LLQYHSHKIYLHNFSNFDATFLFNKLAESGDITPIIHKDRIITISLNFSKQETSRIYTIHFRDSYQILLASLRKLDKIFGVDTQKGIFPHKFVNANNLNYVGAVPGF